MIERDIWLILSALILILLIWNFVEFYFHRKNPSFDKNYFELKAKLNFIVSAASFGILVITYLGFNTQDQIVKGSQPLIDTLIKQKGKEFDKWQIEKNNEIKNIENKSILKNKDIYIVSDLGIKFDLNNSIFIDSTYYFAKLVTITNEKLPIFTTPPKILITTNTGENVRIKNISTISFTVGDPLKKANSLLSGYNADYKNPKFDVWIIDYRK